MPNWTARWNAVEKSEVVEGSAERNFIPRTGEVTVRFKKTNEDGTHQKRENGDSALLSFVGSDADEKGREVGRYKNDPDQFD